MGTVGVIPPSSHTPKNRTQHCILNETPMSPPQCYAVDLGALNGQEKSKDAHKTMREYLIDQIQEKERTLSTLLKQVPRVPSRPLYWYPVHSGSPCNSIPAGAFVPGSRTVFQGVKNTPNYDVGDWPRIIPVVRPSTKSVGKRKALLVRPLHWKVYSHD